MYGKNPVAPIINTDDGLALHLVENSPFATVQGEGPYAGRRATFVRLHGCNLRCTFCDTQFSDPSDPVVELWDLVHSIDEMPAELVVITGGEPMRQNILPLCKELNSRALTVQIETAGTLWIEGIQHYAEIVVSPKTAVIHPQIKQHARAFKYVIDHQQEFDGCIPITATQPNARPVCLAKPREGADIYLSPMDMNDPERNALNRQLVGRLAMRHENTIAGLQLHKFMDLD